MSRATAVATASRDELADAADPSLHRTHMALLAQSRQRTVRETLASRRDLPVGLQAVLADDDWHEVRATIASNPKAARSVLEQLSQDKHRDVLVALIMNPDVPRDLVENLTAHKRVEVREAAETRLRTGKTFRVEQKLTIDERIPELQDRVVAERESLDAAPADAPADTFLPSESSAYAPLPVEPWPVSTDDDGPMWVTTAVLRGRTSPMPGFRISTAT